MFGIYPNVNLFLLQGRVSLDSFAVQSSSSDIMLFSIGIGAIIFLAIVITLINRKKVSNDIKNSSPGSSNKRLGYFTLLNIRRNYGLNKEQGKLLEYVFRYNGVTDAESALQNPQSLDRHFKRAYSQILVSSITDEIAQQKLLKLFSLRNIIEANPDTSSVSPGNLAVDTPAILSLGKENYPVKVLSSRGQNIVTNIPKNALGTPIRMQRGTRIALSFFTKSSSGFSYDGTVVGTVNTDFGAGVQISYGGRPKPLVKRKYRRREIRERCEFSFVNVQEIGKGRKKITKLVVAPKKFLGNISDISVGGCAMRVSTAVPAGARLRINILDDDVNPISILGQVLRSNRSGMSIIIHVRFLKVPRRAYNSINTLVFGFKEM